MARFSGFVLKMLMAGCSSAGPASMSKGPRSEHLLPAVLDHAGSSVTVSLADLQQIKQIKQSLLQRLAEQSDNPDLVKLRQATESETCFITEDGVGHIGAWTWTAQPFVDTRRP